MNQRMRAGWAGVVRRAALGVSVVAIVGASVIGLNDWADAQTVAAAQHSVHDTPAADLD
jgi:hypothetical protein